jgi:hypothetical protein
MSSPLLTVQERAAHDDVIVRVEIPNADLRHFVVRHSAAILDKLVNRCVDDLMSSAAVQARLSALRAEFPARLEAAVAAAITKRLLDR